MNSIALRNIMNYQQLYSQSLKEENTEFIKRINPSLIPDYIANAHTFIIKHIEKYSALPSFDLLNQEGYHYIEQDYLVSDPLGVVFDKFIEKRVSQLTFELMARAKEEYNDTGRISDIDAIIAGLRKINHLKPSNEISNMANDDRAHYNDVVSGFNFGFATMDKWIGGFDRGTYAVIAGRPSVGKSWILLHLAFRVATHYKKRALIISAEMSKVALQKRLDAMMGGFNTTLFATQEGRQKAREYKDSVVEKWQNLLLEGGDIGIPEIAPNVEDFERTIASFNPDIVLVDGLYLVSSTTMKSQGWEKVKQISNKLANISRNMQLPVVATTQLNRSGGEEYDLENIAYSDAIGQDVDYAFFLNGKMHAREREFGIAKSRNGTGFGIINVAFDFEHSTLREA